MEKPNITEGEWRFIEAKSPTGQVLFYDIGIEGSSQSFGASTTNKTLGIYLPESKANAKAISAVPEMIEALIEARKAIELLPDESLGLGSLTDANGEEQFYPLKHELIQNIDEALQKAGVTINEKA